MTETPAPPATRSTSTRLGLWALGLLYVLLYVAFWPPIHTTMDESAYLNQAYVFRQGTIYSDVAGISTVQSYPVNVDGHPHVISQYPPGMGGLLAGISIVGWHAALGLNLAVHLVCFAVLVVVLRRLGLSPWFAGLYLLHPTAVIFSRTTMSDLTSGLLTLLSFLLYLRRQSVAAGIVVGMGVWIRTVGGLALPLLCLGAFLDALYPLASEATPVPFRMRLRAGILNVLKIAAGAIPLVLVAWLYQKFVQENGWAKYSGEGLLGFHHFPHQFPQYALQLGVMFPLMLIAPAFYRRAGRGVLISLCYGVLLFYSCYYFQDTTGSKLESFVIGMRFLLMVLPLFIVAYADMIEKWVSRISTTQSRARRCAIAGGLVAVVLFVGASVIHWKHQKFLKDGAEIRDVIANALGGAQGDDGLLVCNVHVAKLLHPGWSGAHRYVVVGGDSNPDEVARQISQELESGKPTYLAFWSRSYRPETPGEIKLLQSLTQRFKTEKVLPASGTLSPEVSILRVAPRETRRGVGNPDTRTL